MKAYVLHGIGDIRYEEIKRPVLKPGEVLIEVKAAGICGSDIPRIFETGTYSYPLIPGHEFSGVVVEAGGESRNRWLGKRAGVFPLLPCMECAPCREEHYEMCRKYSYLGSRTNGGFAEYVAVPEWNLLELPDNVSYEAAAMLEPMAVAVHAMRRMDLSKKDKVAVCGLGTIGLLLLLFLKEAGIEELFVIGNKEFQKKNALALGIPKERYFDGGKEDAAACIMKAAGDLGVDVFFECVGKNETVSEAVRAAAPGGRIQLVGNPASDMKLDKTVYWKILRNQLTIKGTWNSSFSHEKTDDWHYVLERLKQGAIYPEQYITQKFSPEELEKGLQIMKDKSQEYAKVMILF